MSIMFNKGSKDMANRSENMKLVNKIRSAEVTAMLDLLRELDNGTGGDFGGFIQFGMSNHYDMEGRINSYRAQKIAKYLGKNISKSHLIRFSKDKDILIERDLSVYKRNNISINRISVNEFIDIDGKGLLLYWQYSKGFYINNALIESNRSHS